MLRFVKGNACVERNRGDHSPDQRPHCRNGRQAKQIVKTLVNEIGPLQFIANGPFVRVTNHGVGHVSQLVAGTENVSRPLEVLGDRRRCKGVFAPDAESDARADVIERARRVALSGRHASECVDRQRADHPRLLVGSDPVG